jgi:hypothetical protein
MLVIKKRWEEAKAKKRKFFSWKKLEKVLSIKNFYFYGLQLFSFSSFETFGQIRAKVSFFSTKKNRKKVLSF